MTPEERFHEEEYYAAKNRYSSAAYSESAAEARISELRSRRSHLWFDSQKSFFSYLITSYYQ